MPAAGLPSLPSLVSAAALAGLGLAAMLDAPSSQGLGSAWTGADPDYSRLDERDATLLQRRGVEDLLAAFTKGQLTRHYWGYFAPTLADLGLTADSSLGVRVENVEGVTRLWLTPRRGAEAYLAQVSFNGEQLERLHCRGTSGDEVEANAGQCPLGWTPMKQSAP
ncbi:MAG: thymidylate synthase [Synechococcus sp.]|uniref:thymidylate synthase n=1 Tax=Synechococcus sp. BMK-MC-1 TaxID=1442551 RepID=UPI0016456642|nr:thymidylate synthase [Synechococcus sp. BMK-MC-1]QNI68791.1 putative thymidylate synthase [Synechococcus sp. BMK-MC-1]